jgi:hypothetical protein
MKATKNNNRTSRMVTVLCAAIAFGTSVWAQSDAGSNSGSTDEAYIRLETLMASTEEAVKYTAPPADDAEVKEAMERLELLANNTEKTVRYEAPSTEADELTEAVERLEVLASNIEEEIKYRANPEEQTNAAEYAGVENSRVNEIGDAQTLPTAYISNK